MTKLLIFNQDTDYVGKVVYVDTTKLSLDVKPKELKLARVGRLVAVKISSAVEEWAIAIVERVIKNPSSEQLKSLVLPENIDTEESQTHLVLIQFLTVYQIL